MRCVWLSLSPGTTVLPFRSMSLVSDARKAMISRSLPTAENTPPLMASAVAVGCVGSSVAMRPLKRIVSAMALQSSLQEVDERADRFSWAFLHDPVTGVLDHDDLDVRSDELRLCPESDSIGPRAADREDGHCELLPRKHLEVGRGFRKRREVREARGHAARPRVFLRVRLPVSLRNRMRLVGGKIVPEVLEIDALAALRQCFRR